MEDVVEALVRLVGRLLGEVVRAVVELVWELLLHGSARLIYGRGDRPRHRVQRFVFRLAALSGAVVAVYGLVHGVPGSPWQVLGVVLTMFALLVMMIGECEYGRKGLFWLAVFALVSLFGALGSALTT